MLSFVSSLAGSHKASRDSFWRPAPTREYGAEYTALGDTPNGALPATVTFRCSRVVPGVCATAPVGQRVAKFVYSLCTRDRSRFHSAHPLGDEAPPSRLRSSGCTSPEKSTSLSKSSMPT